MRRVMGAVALGLAMTACEVFETEPAPPPLGCLSLSRTALDLGEIPANTAVTDVIRVDNDCGDSRVRQAVRFRDVRFEDGSVFGFAGSFWPRVSHREAGFIQVEVYTDVPGPHFDVLVLETDHPDFPEIVIPASATVSTAEPVLDAGLDAVDAWIGCSTRFPVTVTNDGTGRFVLDEIGVGGERPSEFSVEYDLERFGPLPWDIPPSEQVDVEVVFTPTSVVPNRVGLYVETVPPTSIPVTGAGFVGARQTDRFVHVPAQTDEQPAIYPLTREWFGDSVEFAVDGVVVSRLGWSVRRDPPQLEVARSAPFRAGAELMLTYIVPPEDCEAPR